MPSPIDMPDPLKVNSKQFDISYNQLNNPSGSGFIQTIDRGPSYWVAKYSTPPLSGGQEDIFQAFLDQLRGSANTFYGFDPRRPQPKAYLGQPGNPWEYTPGSISIGNTDEANSKLLSLEGFAPGAIITAGDYISLMDGTIGDYRLFRIAGNYTADGDGQFAELLVAPAPPDSKSGAGRMKRAVCPMKILGGVSKTDKVEDPGPSFTFTAVQYIPRITS